MNLANLIKQSSNTVVFTGAGMSTESGISDFRSPGGVWAKYSPVYFDQFMASEDARREYWRQKCEVQQEFRGAVPNQGHRVLADWEQRGWVRGVITQNIDGLHQLAGNRHVLELHGTACEAACMSCLDRQPIQPLVDEFLATNRPPTCVKCAGPMKHATISFGQSLPTDVLEESLRWMEQADLVFALGSSLVVQPAAGLPHAAVQRGARLIIINREPTPLDSIADLVLHQPLGRTLTETNAALS